MIIQGLHDIQDIHGYLPTDELESLAQRLRVPLFRLQEVASFFPHFRLKPPATVEIGVCHDMACQLAGSARLKLELEKQFDAERTAGHVAVKFVSCLGRCDRAAAVSINDHLFCRRKAPELVSVAQAKLAGQEVPADLDAAAPRVGPAWQIDIYQGQPSYAAVRAYVQHNDPARVIEQLKIADLRGMGGAGIWAHQKWNDVARAHGSEKYIICNADESEPGTFKDRELLLRTPYLVLEGVILAGLVTGATRGYIYVRHEYHEQIEAMKAAISNAERQGVCGRRILGTGRDFPVEVFTSPGGYICGEQSALVEAMEDHRAQPRNKPPQLETNGLYDKPTLVSNVETFAWVPAILVNGGAWYAERGVNGCKGLRYFSISGAVKRPGAYEVANGITLGQFLSEYALGVEGQLKAFAPSGPSGGFLPRRIPVNRLSDGWQNKVSTTVMEKIQAAGGSYLDILDLEMDLQHYRDLGLMLGAGLVVYNQTTDIVAAAYNASEFFRNESCGKCVPCRIGSQKVVEIGHRLMAGKYNEAQFKQARQLIDELAETMELTSICGLGVVAAKPLVSATEYFPLDVTRHFPAAVTKPKVTVQEPPR